MYPLRPKIKRELSDHVVCAIRVQILQYFTAIDLVQNSTECDGLQSRVRRFAEPNSVLFYFSRSCVTLM